jgi:hypothetical protein
MCTLFAPDVDCGWKTDRGLLTVNKRKLRKAGTKRHMHFRSTNRKVGSISARKDHHQYRKFKIDSPVRLPDAEVRPALEKVAIAFIFADKDLKAFEQAIRKHAAQFPNVIFYSDTITSNDPPVQPCCGGTSLGADIVNAQYKMEQT